MKEKVSVFMDMFIAGYGVRHRFEVYLGKIPKPIKLDDEVDDGRFKSVLKNFCAENPTCMSKVRL